MGKFFLYLTQTHISILKISTIEYEIEDVKKLANRIDRELCRQITEHISERDKLENAALVNMLRSEVCDIGTALTITYVLNDGVLVYEKLGSNSRGEDDSNDSNDETVHGFHVRGHVAVAPVKPLQTHTDSVKDSVQDSVKPPDSLETLESLVSLKSETDKYAQKESVVDSSGTDDLSAFERELANLEIREIGQTEEF
tara:strand:+ start:1834 stop:2427 length:594 start_codon:yes stop_codon:yes gene_type:complete